MSGIISIPGGICCLFIIAKAGRKTTLNVFQIIATICFMAIFILPKDAEHEVWIFIFAGLGFAVMAVSSVPYRGSKKIIKFLRQSSLVRIYIV